MPISDITARSIAKGKALVNAFDAWKTGTDKILPMRAVKFIGKHVASPVSRFQHPTRGVYHVLSATAQVEQRDNKLRNIFESVARELVPGRETRKLEYEAAELLRDKGGKIAKDRRKRREKGETKLLARLALECELCLMGSKSWSAYDKALRSDGVVDAIRTSLVRSDDSDSDSDANTVSLKTATAAWTKAQSAMVSPNARSGSRSATTPDRRMADMFRSLKASLRSVVAAAGNNPSAFNGNAGWALDSGAGRVANTRGGARGNCWQCNLPGHAWYEKDKCSLSGQTPAVGSVHASKAAKRKAANRVPPGP